MPQWRCPHCQTPQAETSRCWVCKRSSTSCGTCTHFRRAIAGQIGYCGLDPRRTPLVGDETRGCWTAPGEILAEAPSEHHSGPTGGHHAFVDAPKRVDFVPLDTPPGAHPPAVVLSVGSEQPERSVPDAGLWSED